MSIAILFLLCDVSERNCDDFYASRQLRGL